MRMLVLESATGVAGAAVAEDGILVCEINLASGRTHAQQLLPIVDQCLTLAQWEKASLDMLGCVCGPGSFTGVRIGVSTAKGIAMGLNIPVIALNTLEVLAAGNLAEREALIVTLIDARRSEVYAAAYRSDGQTLCEVLPPCTMPLSELLSLDVIQEASKLLFCGDGVAPNRDMLDALGSRSMIASSLNMHQRSAAAAYLAHTYAMQDKAISANMLLPLYIRASAAQTLKQRGLPDPGDTIIQ